METTRDGVTTFLDATGEELHTSSLPADKGDKPLNLEVVTTGRPSGTRVVVWIPPVVYDESTGEPREQKVPGDSYDDDFQAVKRSPLFRDINVKINGDTQWLIGENFNKDIDESDKYVEYATVKFRWGTAKVWKRDYSGYLSSDNVYVLSNGHNQNVTHW